MGAARRRMSGRARWALIVGTAFAVAVALYATRLGDSHAEFELAKVSNQVLVDTANGKETSFVIYLADQADVSAAYGMADQDARGWYVYDTLRKHAAETQAPLKAALEADGVPFRSFWAANMIVAEGGRELVAEVAARADVKAIESNDGADWTEDDEGPETVDEGNATEAIEVGLNNVKAPSIWTLGFTGQGIVVANQDTGMRWTHNALRAHYRGWGGSVATSVHDYNWHDSVHARITGADGGTASGPNNSCGYNLVVPCDDQGHGTHTTGTVVGDDAATNQIGVAPGAKWIGCRNMDAGNGRPATYAECFQFFIAPTDLGGQNADPTKRPHVMNNSWGCPASELCAANTLQTITDNTMAVGIFVEASAGNDGPNCSTVQDPPAIYTSAFATGAISGTTNALTSFSSRGPVIKDGSNRLAPDIVAPGSSVRSSLRNSDTSYGNMSGTSMAGPHVVGAVALLWSARPRLVRDIARTEYLLRHTANPAVTVPNNAAGCGGIASIPNNHFGFGRLDVLAAYNAEPSLVQTIAFPAIAKSFGEADFAPGATASSGLPVSYVASGECKLVNGLIHLTGLGACTVKASQAGNEAHYPADDVTQTFTVTWPTTNQVPTLHTLIGEFGLGATPADELNASVAKVETTLSKGRPICDGMNDLLATAILVTGSGAGELPFAAAQQLFQAGNATEVTAGCIAAASPRPAAESDLIGLLQTVDGMGLSTDEASSLDQQATTVTRKVIAGSSETCARLASLRVTLLRDVGKGNLTQAQANTLVAIVDGVNAKLAC
jgi:serine protease AprX